MPVETLTIVGNPGEFSIVDSRLWNVRRVVSVKRNGVTQYIISNNESITAGMSQCQYIGSTSRVQFSAAEPFTFYVDPMATDDTDGVYEKVHIIYIP